MESVTIDAIAEAVGVTEGAIYRHFQSKREILTLLIDDIEESLMGTLRSARVEDAPARENLERILEAHLSDVEGRGAVSFIIISEATGFDGIGLQSRVALMLTHYLEFLQEVLEDGKREGSIRPDVDVPGGGDCIPGSGAEHSYSLGPQQLPAQAGRETRRDVAHIHGRGCRSGMTPSSYGLRG